METEPRHQCMIYEGSPSQKLPMLAAIIQRKLNEGYRCLYLNSPPIVAEMLTTLTTLGIDVESETSKKRLILSCEPVTPDGEFNSKEMLRNIESALDEAISDGFNGLWASGDMTWEFGPKPDFSKLLDYELALEELFIRRKELQGVCQYHRDTLPNDVIRQSLLGHRSVVINDTLSRINPHFKKTLWPADLNTIRQLDTSILSLLGC